MMSIGRSKDLDLVVFINTWDDLPLTVVSCVYYVRTTPRLGVYPTCITAMYCHLSHSDADDVQVVSTITYGCHHRPCGT